MAVTRPTTMSLLLLVIFALFVGGNCGCSKRDWTDSFEHEGVSDCGADNDYINGFYRSGYGDPDRIGRLEEVTCCSRDSPYFNSDTLVVYADWWQSFDWNNHWNTCPNGFFLQGLYRTDSNPWLYNIEEGKCAKPATHPNHYGHCYDQDVTSSFDDAGDSNCNPGYFITGLWRGGCDRLYCLEWLRCCKMAPSPAVLDSQAAVKTRVMDITLPKMALLAHFLGYGWCAGCRSQYVGQDFRRNGDTWEADKSGRCSGYMSDQRLNINYGDWKFGMKNIQFGQPVIHDLTPETIDSGIKINNDPNPSTETVTREERVVRTVTHTVTSSWKKSHELGVTITYTPASTTGGVGGSASYKFNYESSQTTTDSTAKQQYKSFKIEETKTLPGYSASNWTLILSKTRSTVTYTATVIAQFSAEFRGFMRWGGGPNAAGTNYHVDNRGSGARNTINYRFGNAHTPFYTALKEESDNNQRPWLWSDMKNSHSSAQQVINGLTNEGQYEFTLSGRFEDISGKYVNFRWDEIQNLRGVLRRRRSSSDNDNSNTGTNIDSRSSAMDNRNMKYTIATAKDWDSAAIFQDPPPVELYDAQPWVQMDRVKVSEGEM